MAMTTLNDIFAANRTASYDVIQSYMDDAGDLVSQTPFFEAGILTTNAIVDQVAAGPTPEVTLPYFGRLDSTVEPNYSNDVYEDIAIPHRLGTGFMKARTAFLNEGWGSMSLVAELTGIDPLQRVAGRLNRYWQEEAELRLLASLRGIYALAATDMNVAVTATGSVYDGIIDGQLTLGDNFGAVTGIVMDSRTFGRAVKEKIAEASMNRTTNILERTLNGLPVIVSDKAMRAADGASIIALLGPNAFAYGMANPRIPLEYEREAARGNGGGAETLWTRRNMIVHPLGYSFLSASITGNGSETTARSAGWTDLANPANWQRSVDRKAVPIAFVTVATKA